ncbi:LOW QUALITY PROTEIN: hypothetical protein TorRG33x02_233940 [Trema orientale]|uniref:Uncharacterized protein n=1 Tax=Trema orientale TaxID=63057 RepID=A0A2P5E4H8_TREOI|nr:LOW QUALITY PROTEIN: hypothetical protein TorRG33x02_233940 [Trema orientale]
MKYLVQYKWPILLQTISLGTPNFLSIHLVANVQSIPRHNQNHQTIQTEKTAKTTASSDPTMVPALLVRLWAPEAFNKAAAGVLSGVDDSEDEDDDESSDPLFGFATAGAGAGAFGLGAKIPRGSKTLSTL